MSKIIRSVEGKIGYVDWGMTRLCPAYIEIELRETLRGDKELVICGNIKSANGRGYYCGGQCRETLKETFKRGNKHLLDKICQLWEKWHLNTMHSGTDAQEELIKVYCSENNYTSYSEAREYLEKHNLLIDNGHEYGNGWLVREISDDVLQQINEVMDELSKTR